MAHVDLRAVLRVLARNLRETEQLAAAAQRWSLVSFSRGVPRFSSRHRDIVTELAFLQVFLAWERFLEESFILYLLGKKPPKGGPPRRYFFPRSRKVAERIVVPEGRPYADWTAASAVITRAERFFSSGKPFAPALKSQTSLLDEMKTLRNAITHSSTAAQEKFQNLTRNKFGTYPTNLTVGGFLAMAVPGSSPPESFIEYYIDRITVAAETIIPT